MVESFVPSGENPDWSDQPPQQNPPGWRPTWRPKKQRKRRAAAPAPAPVYPGYAAPYPQPAAPQYQPPPYPAPQPAPVPARVAYPYQAQRLPQTSMAPEAEPEYEPFAVPDAPDDLGRPEPLRQVTPYPDVELLEAAADRARVRPSRDYLGNWRGRAVIRSAPNIAEIAIEQARVPLRVVDFARTTRDRATRSDQVARDRIAAFRDALQHGPFVR